MGVTRVRARVLGGGARVRSTMSPRNSNSAQAVLFLPVKREVAPDAQRVECRKLDTDLSRHYGGFDVVR